MNKGDTLHENEYLSLGQYLMNGKGVKAILQKDGNFVIYKGEKALWASGTEGKFGTMLIMQKDGNLVLYNNVENRYVWAT